VDRPLPTMRRGGMNGSGTRSGGRVRWDSVWSKSARWNEWKRNQIWWTGPLGFGLVQIQHPASVRCARQPNKFVAAATARLRSVPPPAVTDQPAPTPIRQLLRSIYSDKLAHQLPCQARKTPQASIMFCFVIDSSRSASGPST
jgi:hypothetical protein